MYSQDFILTSLVLVGALAGLFGLSRYERRPRDSLKPPMLPTTPIILVLVFVVLLSVVHLINMGGIKTGS